MRSKNVMPIICGGTNYYIESLIWKILIEDETKCTKEPISVKKAKVEISVKINDDNEKGEMLRSNALEQETDERLDDGMFDDISNVELHKRLKKIDQQRANELHVNERRKIIRSLEVYEKHNRLHSEILNDQKSENGGNVLGGPLRFSRKELAVLWVQCDQSILDKRCNKRVDKMIKEGMINELKDFHKSFNKKRESTENTLDYTNGIFQSIGFKEFHEYLTCNESESEESKRKLYEKGKQKKSTEIMGGRGVKVRGANTFSRELLMLIFQANSVFFSRCRTATDRD